MAIFKTKATAESVTVTGVVERVGSVLIWALLSGEIGWVRSMAAVWMAAVTGRWCLVGERR